MTPERLAELKRVYSEAGNNWANRALILELIAEVERLQAVVEERTAAWEYEHADNARLREALEWYASPEQYRYATHEPGEVATYMGTPAVVSDDGKRARTALEGKK